MTQSADINHRLVLYASELIKELLSSLSTTSLKQFAQDALMSLALYQLSYLGKIFLFCLMEQ